MIFKTRIITQAVSIYGYEKEADDRYCLSFIGRVNPTIDGVEFLNLISTKNLTLSEFDEMFRYVNETVKEMKYERWFMDVLPENRTMAERYKPFKEEKVNLFNKINLIRFWYNVEAK